MDMIECDKIVESKRKQLTLRINVINEIVKYYLLALLPESFW